ncbi:MAG: L,D-transpeptidase family protein, partial [Croceibacterium sp.]
FDGVDTARLRPDRLAKLIAKAGRGDADSAAQADVELSRALAAYVRAMRGADHEPMIYESAALQPIVPTAQAVLDAAARAASLDGYVADMGWMHPLYAPLRKAMADTRYSDAQHRLIWANLARIRAIPALSGGKYILVDAASARLWMYDGGKPVDSMKVVVGKPDLQTPMMAGFVRTAILNPYWNVPDDLVRTKIAASALDKGAGYLKSEGYQVFANWDDHAVMLDPASVDWQAVHDGATQVHVRQLPGGSNFMGKVKFEFPNPKGIYLHDTPDKGLLKLADRQLSSGCVRLEDAARMHRWLMGAPLPVKVRQVEQAVPLPQMVPIYITYLTALPQPDGQIAFHTDPYARDGLQLAAADVRGARTDRP